MVYGPMVHHSHYRKIWHFPCAVKVSLGSGFCVWVIPLGYSSLLQHWQPLMKKVIDTPAIEGSHVTEVLHTARINDVPIQPVWS